MRDDYFCSAMKLEIINGKTTCEGMKKCNPHCVCYRRKYESPEDFKKRRLRKYPDNMAVYVLHDNGSVFYITDYKHAKMNWRDKTIICANTDFGPPPDGWTPDVGKEGDNDE